MTSSETTGKYPTMFCSEKIGSPQAISPIIGISVISLEGIILDVLIVSAYRGSIADFLTLKVDAILSTFPGLIVEVAFRYPLIFVLEISVLSEICC